MTGVLTCGHPAVAPEAQVALALRWLSGMSTEDVARALCVPTATMAQHLTRAKAKIEPARLPHEVPDRGHLDERLGTVLEVIYGASWRGAWRRFPPRRAPRRFRPN